MAKIGFSSDLGITKDQIIGFYQENWGKEIILSNNKFYDWQFICPPKNNNLDSCVVAIDNSSNIMGVMGLNKRDFFLDGQKFNGAELTSWVVSKDSINSGYGAKILIFIQKEFEILIGMGITNQAIPIYLKRGFRFFSQISRFVKIIKDENIKQYFHSNEISDKITKKWKFKQENRNYIVKNFSKERLEDLIFDSRFKFNLFSRGIDDVNWRFENHPYFNYKKCFIYSNELENSPGAFVVLREENSNKEIRILHVLDMLGIDESLNSGIRFIEDYAYENNFDLVDFYSTSSYVNSFFYENKWFSINDDRYFQFPHLFQPIELRDPPTTSLVVWSKINLRELLDFSKLYITKQDCDLDRPTINFLKGIN